MTDPDIQLANTALDLVADSYLVEHPDLDGSLDFDLQDLCAILGFVERSAVAVNEVRKQVKAAIAKQIGSGGTVRFGGTIYRSSPSVKYVVDDGPAMMEWLGEEVADAFNPQNVRLGVLKHIAARRGYVIKSITDTFGHYETNQDSLTVVPVDKARVWEQKLSAEGGRNYPKPKPISELTGGEAA